MFERGPAPRFELRTACDAANHIPRAPRLSNQQIYISGMSSSASAAFELAFWLPSPAAARRASVLSTVICVTATSLCRDHCWWQQRPSARAHGSCALRPRRAGRHGARGSCGDPAHACAPSRCGGTGVTLFALHWGACLPAAVPGQLLVEHLLHATPTSSLDGESMWRDGYVYERPTTGSYSTCSDEEPVIARSAASHSTVLTHARAAQRPAPSPARSDRYTLRLRLCTGCGHALTLLHSRPPQSSPLFSKQVVPQLSRRSSLLSHSLVQRSRRRRSRRKGHRCAMRAACRPPTHRCADHGALILCAALAALPAPCDAASRGAAPAARCPPRLRFLARPSHPPRTLLPTAACPRQ